jgi:hypothetical protein
MLRLSAVGFVLAMVMIILVGIGDVQVCKVPIHVVSTDLRAFVNAMRR